jgi:UDP-galactopyranose mutase
VKEYDFLIVGAGLFGATFARLVTDKGKKCLVIEQRNHIAGNCYTENVEGINVHKYGPHIFHTKDKNIWKFVNQYAEFNNFRYRVKAFYKDRLYSFPINMSTLHELYGVILPSEAREVINQKKINSNNLDNVEDWCLSQIGTELYEMFIKGYTTKQWGRHPKDVPAYIIKRIPIRFTYSDYYFDDLEYQGIPIGGYTKLIERLLNGIEVRLGINYLEEKPFWDSTATQIVYTGELDRLLNFKYGKLPYRSLRFENEVIYISDYQGIAAINYTEEEISYTRKIEHKHFEFGNQPFTIVTTEFPQDKGEPYYPIETDRNLDLYSRYLAEMKTDSKIIFGGRLAEYKYLNMDQAIQSAMQKAEECLKLS